MEIRTLEQKEAVAQYARLALRALGDVENALAAGQSLADREPMLRQDRDRQQRALELSRRRATASAATTCAPCSSSS